MSIRTETGSRSQRTGRCATEHPIVLAHGMGFQAKIMGVVDYWGTIPGALVGEGADVHVTTVNAMDTQARKTDCFRGQVLGILEKTGARKVNVIGHSSGCLYSSFAITHLGLAPYVASHTGRGKPLRRGGPAPRSHARLRPGPLLHGHCGRPQGDGVLRHMPALLVAGLFSCVLGLRLYL